MLKLADLAVREDFSLGPLWVSPALRFIKGPAGQLHVEPLTMQVFLLLADANGHVVTRNRLYDECWGGVSVGDYSLNRTITMVRRIASEAAPGAFRIESIPRTGYRLLLGAASEGKPISATRRWDRSMLSAAAMIGVLALAGSAWFFLGRAADHPSVAISAGGDPISASLGEGIASAAMSAAAQYQTPLRLMAGTDADDDSADFVLKVRETSAANERRIDLSVVSRAGRSVLWNWSASQQPTATGSLDQEARAVGALVLACAAETRTDANRRPDEETVRLYLDACSKFEPWFGTELRLLPDVFEQVTMRAPQIGGAWSRLFLSKAEGIEGLPRIDYVNSLRNDIRNSVARHVEVPEIYIARAAVLPLNARFERLQLYDAGLARYPRRLSLLMARSWQLRSVGRMDEAAKTAGEAVALYPQSLAANAEYARSLMHSGRTDAARSVLDRAAQTDPDAPNLRSVRWILELRYGDAKRALALAQSGGSVVETPMVSFLEARVNPTKSNIDRAIADLLEGYKKFPVEPGWVAQALGSFGRTEEAIDFLLRYPGGANSGDGAEMLFRPYMRAVRRDRRFMLIARNFGVADYWQKSGILPDFCFEPDLPYDCARELARMRS